MPWFKRATLPINRPPPCGSEFLALRDECKAAGLHIRYDHDAQTYFASPLGERDYERAYESVVALRQLLKRWQAEHIAQG